MRPSIPPVVYDDTAMVALFHDESQAFPLWRRAERGQRLLIFPVVAMAEATANLSATESDWRVFLDVANVHDAELTASVAIIIGSQPGTLATRQVIHEARAFQAPILTGDPHRYSGTGVPVIVL